MTIDKELSSKRGEEIRDLLYIFGKDEAFRLIAA
jgi:hypothetical protein